MRISPIFAVLVMTIFVAGCADMDFPKPTDMLSGSAMTSGLNKGMSKSEVESKYGEPAVKTLVSAREWGGQREEWMYKANYSVLPVNAGHLSEDLYLYFDGNNLTNISKKPLGKHMKEIVDEAPGRTQQ